MMKLILLLSLTLLMVGATRPPSQTMQRLPLQKTKIILKSPTEYEKRILRYDPQSKTPVYYDPKPQVVRLDAKTGRYSFKWIGYDGKEKRIPYQRADAINAVVSASVERTSSGQYTYTYSIKNLPSSGEHLSIFTVQNFAPDSTPLKAEDIYAGPASNNKEMKNGSWLGFGLLTPGIIPGRSIELKVASFAPPGLVECRVAGGEQGLKGVGEDMPQELENVLPGYEAWPKGYTIGPNASLRSASVVERFQAVLAWLPQFKRLGWMSPTASAWYKRNIGRADMEKIHQRANQDLKTGNITTEVFAIVQTIKQR